MRPAPSFADVCRQISGDGLFLGAAFGLCMAFLAGAVLPPSEARGGPFANGAVFAACAAVVVWRWRIASAEALALKLELARQMEAAERAALVEVLKAEQEVAASRAALRRALGLSLDPKRLP